MGRARTIAAVALASGILVGGSVISVYAINAAVVAEDPPHTVIQTAVAAVDPLPETQTETLPETQTQPAEPAEDAIGPEDLMVISSDDELIVPEVPTTVPEQTSTNRSQTTGKGTDATTVSRRTVSVATAQRVVTRASGGRLLATWASQRGGVPVFAVKVQRGDGSVVVGYVDRRTGSVVDWVRVSTARSSAPRTARPTPAATPRPTHREPSVRPTPSATTEQFDVSGSESDRRQPAEPFSAGQESTPSGNWSGGEQSDD